MSHVTGTVQPVQPNMTIGPTGGGSQTAPNQWRQDFAPTPAPTGTKFVVLHFHQADFPGTNRLEVGLGYDTDVFTAADGAEFWTRPVNLSALPGGLVPIMYISDGVNQQGRVRLDQYGRGERHAGYADPTSESNSDPFLLSSPYEEPDYDPFWFCTPPNPRWENLRCATPATDVRRNVARAVGMLVTVHTQDPDHGPHVSTCSGTLIGPDLFISAGHCFNHDSEALTSAVTFDNETECNSDVPGGYAARFHKVVRVVTRHWNFSVVPPFDYVLLQLAPAAGGFGVTPIPLRPGLPGVGEQIFGVHHPNGAVKKLSPAHASTAAVLASDANHINVNIDVSGGSSGSGLFDMQGRYLGVLSNGGPCSLSYFPIPTINDDLENPATPAVTRDVMLVVDRSGSMSEDAGTGQTKVDEARDAASLFVQLVRAGTGNRLGLVSFSSAATTPFGIAAVDTSAKATLVGASPPYSGGVVGGLMPGGSTSVGAGLEAARQQFPAPGTNPRAILLLTDGMQNTPPSVESIESALGGVEVQVVGFGTEANLDGALLTGLAQRHDGLYTRAGSGLHLKKFFALAFANMFEAGALQDPDQVLGEDEWEAKPIPFQVCDEDSVTVVLGWERPQTPLRMRVKAPNGVLVDASAAGVHEDRGATWRFMRIELPQGATREGEWQVEVFRDKHGGEAGRGAVVRYFVNVAAAGGPRLSRMPDRGRRWFTGDAFNPLVVLRRDDGSTPLPASVQVTVSRPDDALGDVLAKAGLSEPQTVDGDTIPARQATLAALEQEGGGPVIGRSEETFDLSDRPEDTGLFVGGRGIFGRRLEDLLNVEGDYTFHARARYGDACVATREALWSLHVDVGIDPGRTDIDVNSRPGGQVAIAIVPRDRYGHLVGPGRAGDLSVAGVPGTTVTGPAQDNGHGSYTVTGTWDQGSSHPPGIVLEQPGRPAVVIQQPPGDGPAFSCRWWKLLALVLAILAVVLLVLLVLL